MTAATVTCIVPVFNGERYLADALESVFAQTRPPDEVVVVDDGSTDGSAAVVARYGERVRCLRQPNGGPASARNRGLTVAAGHLVAFIDQDDLWHPEKLERQIACFAEDRDLDLCFCHVERFWAPELRAEEDSLRHHPRGGRVPGYSTPALLARRSAFERLGPLDASLLFADATDWTLRAIESGLRTKLLPEALVYHRMHATNLTRRREASKAEFLRVVRAALARRRSAPMDG